MSRLISLENKIQTHLFLEWLIHKNLYLEWIDRVLHEIERKGYYSTPIYNNVSAKYLIKDKFVWSTATPPSHTYVSWLRADKAWRIFLNEHTTTIHNLCKNSGIP